MTLIDALENELDMGTAFDSFSEKSASYFYEHEQTGEEEIRNIKNRLSVMLPAADFVVFRE